LYTNLPNFFNAVSEISSPKPGFSFKCIHPLFISCGFSNNSACKGSLSLSNDSTIRPEGVDATRGACI